MSAIFHKSAAPIVRLAADGERELMRGFPLLREGYAPKPVTNMLDELTSCFWRPSIEARRCPRARRRATVSPTLTAGQAGTEDRMPSSDEAAFEGAARRASNWSAPPPIACEVYRAVRSSGSPRGSGITESPRLSAPRAPRESRCSWVA